MAGNKAAIKSRIKSINATKKITGAMQLIASVKLQRTRNLMFKNKQYANAIKSTVAKMLSGDIEIDNEYLKEKDAPLKVYFVFASDMGLCGGYNINLDKVVRSEVSKDDLIYYFGTENYSKLKEDGYNIRNKMTPSDSIDYITLKSFVDSTILRFKDNEINSINVIYTVFENNVSFKPIVEKVLPCGKVEGEINHKEILFEPSPDKILNDLIPMMVDNEIYARYLEAKASEHGSRRFAMENATDNANELTDELLLEYNQARQAAITTELNEIVAGADAL